RAAACEHVDSASGSGAVYVFTRSGTTWIQQAYVKASNTEANDQFGYSVALSANGSTLAVGAIKEDSKATGIGGDEADNSALGSGAVYVFTRSDATWIQQAYVKASNPRKDGQFGASVALSGDGSTLAVGAPGEDGSVIDVGAVYVFTHDTMWTQQMYLKASNPGAGDQFGASVALSGDGSTLAVGAHGEGSVATGVGGDQANNAAVNAGAVYVFMRCGMTWGQQAYVKATNTEANDRFGASVALATDGSTLAVGAREEDSAVTGIGGNQADNSTRDAG